MEGFAVASSRQDRGAKKLQQPAAAALHRLLTPPLIQTTAHLSEANFRHTYAYKFIHSYKHHKQTQNVHQTLSVDRFRHFSGAIYADHRPIA
jgi:hypothetical protein